MNMIAVGFFPGSSLRTPVTGTMPGKLGTDERVTALVERAGRKRRTGMKVALKYIEEVLKQDGELRDLSPRARKADYFLKRKVEAAAFEHFIQTCPYDKGKMLEVLVEKLGRI